MVMSKLIKQLLREAMIAFIDDWIENLSQPFKDGNSLVITTLISKDDETGDKLWLIVGLEEKENYHEFTFPFLLTDKDNQPKSTLMLLRSQVKPFIPQEIRNKRQIIPIIQEMTRKLLDTQLPKNILIQTAEPVDGDSLIRYQQLIDIMVSEYDYTLSNTDKTQFGTTEWYLTRNKVTDDNKELNEKYLIKHKYSLQENVDKFYLPILSKLFPIK